VSTITSAAQSSGDTDPLLSDQLKSPGIVRGFFVPQFGVRCYPIAGQGESFVSRASLVETYIAALNLTAVTVVADGRRCRIETGGEIAPGEKIKRQFYFKSSHAELVLLTIDKEGPSGKSPAALAAPIERAAATLGAQVARAEKAVPYATFLERYTATIVRDVAGRMI
jgi:hypothetical protein